MAGFSYDVLFGPKFGTFDKAGFKFRPVGVAFNKKYNASFTLRYYPQRFTSEDFGVPNLTQEKDERRVDLGLYLRLVVGEEQ